MDEKKRRAAEELARRLANRAKVDFDRVLFDKQQKFVLDKSRLKAALCTRRSGKTFSLMAYAIRVCMGQSFVKVPYIALTKGQAKNNVWLTLQELNRTWKLGAKFHHVDLTVTFPNGSIVQLYGADDPSEIGKHRGAKYPLAIIDEAQLFGTYLRSFIHDVLEPCVSDFNGTIVLAGTPGLTPAGYYWEITTQATEEAKAWTVHKWNVGDNPHHPYDAEAIEALRLRNRWPIDHPTLRREWYGEWVEDNDIRVYRYRPQINDSHEKPTANASWVLGLDLGYEDSSGFVILAYDEKVGRVWVTKAWKEQHLIPSAMAARVERIRTEYDISRIVADTGGFGKGYVEEMRQRYGIAVEAAQKQNKRGYIELINGDFQSGLLTIDRDNCLPLIDELTTLQWQTKADDSIDYEKIDDRFDDHAADALLYAWRSCRHFNHDFEENPPKPGTFEAMQKLEQEIEEAVTAKLQRAGSTSFWEQDYPESLDEAPFLLDATWL